MFICWVLFPSSVFLKCVCVSSFLLGRILTWNFLPVPRRSLPNSGLDFIGSYYLKWQIEFLQLIYFSCNNFDTTSLLPTPSSHEFQKNRNIIQTLAMHQKTSINKRPTFGQWIRLIWLDILTLVLLSIIAMPLWFFSCFTVRVSYRVTEFHIYTRPWWCSLFYILATPSTVITTILLCQFFIRSFWDTNNAIIGILFSVAGSLAFTKILQLQTMGFHLRGKWGTILDRFLVTQSTVAFASFVFLSLYCKLNWQRNNSSKRQRHYFINQFYLLTSQFHLLPSV